MMLPRSTIPDTAAGYEVRERGASPGLIVQADVDVPHRHADVVVAGQFTGCDEEVTAAQQLGDLSLPPCHVYTGSCCFGLVGDASPPEALFEHQQVCRYIRSIIDIVFREPWARIKGHRFRPNATYPIPMARPIRPTVIDLSERS